MRKKKIGTNEDIVVNNKSVLIVCRDDETDQDYDLIVPVSCIKNIRRYADKTKITLRNNNNSDNVITVNFRIPDNLLYAMMDVRVYLQYEDNSHLVEEYGEDD